jgi:hypothetical protein
VLQVPFTLRKHTLLLPVFAELLLGQFSFSQVLQQVRPQRMVLPSTHGWPTIQLLLLRGRSMMLLQPFAILFGLWSSHQSSSQGMPACHKLLFCCSDCSRSTAARRCRPTHVMIPSTHSHNRPLLHTLLLIHCLQPQYRGKALPPDHKDSQLVQRIAERIISAVEEGHGGGFQKHIRKVRTAVCCVWGCVPSCVWGMIPLWSKDRTGAHPQGVHRYGWCVGLRAFMWCAVLGAQDTLWSRDTAGACVGPLTLSMLLLLLLMLLLLLQFDWEVVVLDDPTVNAFVLPGGKIVVFTGEPESSVFVGTATDRQKSWQRQTAARRFDPRLQGCCCAATLTPCPQT